MLVWWVALGSALCVAIAAIAFQDRRQTALIERALYPEVNAMRFQAAAFACELARRHNAGIPLDAEFFSTWRLSTPLIYPAAGAQLGHLSPDTADRVGYFHAQLGEARRRIAEARSLGADTLSTYRLLSNLLRAHNHIEPWITATASSVGNLNGGRVDLTEAARLLERFETFNEEPLAWVYCWADTCAPGSSCKD